MRWLLPLCAILFLLAVAPKASAAGYSMTISNAASSGGGCSGGVAWIPTQDNANLNVNDIANCAAGSTLTIGNGGAIDVQGWPSSLPVAVTLDGDSTIETSMSQFDGLTVEGITSFTGASEVDTGTGPQSYQGPVTLDADTTLSASDTSFSATVDSGSPPGALTVSGSADFGGTVGGINELTSLTQTGGGTVTLAGSVATSGAQSYSGAVALGIGADQLTASTLTFGSTLDGQSNTNTPALTLASTGPVAFEGNVGATTRLASLDVAASAITVDGEILSSGAQTYESAVMLRGDASFNASSGGDITFASTIDGAHSLSVSASGSDYFNGAIGSQTPLTSILVNGGSPETELSGGVTTTGAQQFGSNLSLASNVSFSSSSTVYLQGVISGSHQITMTGGGSMNVRNLSQAADSYDGTVVTGGSTVNFASGALGSGPITLNDGTLTWTDGNTSDVSSQLQIGNGGGTLDSHGYDLSFAHSIGGSGPLTKTGAGTLTLNTASGSYGSQIIVDGGSVAVPAGTAVTTPVVIDAGGTLNCSDGTLSGGVSNEGGIALGAPDPLTGVSATPGFEAATLSFDEPAPNCYPISYRVSTGGLSWTPASSPATLNGLAGNQAYTFTLTASNPIGSVSASASTTPTGPADPSVSISSPSNGATYSYGQTVDAGYACLEGTGGLGIASCSGPVSSGAALDTTAPGQHTFTVTATSLDGLTASMSVTYTVLAPAVLAPPVPTPPVPAPLSTFKIRSVKANRAGTITVSLSSLPGPGKVTVTERVAKLPASSVRKGVGTKSTLTLRLPASKRLRRLLKKHGSVSVKLTIAYAPTNGTTRSAVRSLRVK